MFLLNNIKVHQDIQRTIGDTQYPAGWFSHDAAARAKVGMIEVPDPVRPDDKLFTSVENPDGSYTATARTAADLAARLVTEKNNFILQIDTDADALIRTVIGERASQYESAEKQSAAYKAAGYTGTVPPKVQAWATAKNQTATWAADSQIATAAGWRAAEDALYAKRLLLKETAKAAVDGAALDAVKAQWAAFMGGLRTSLGA